MLCFGKFERIGRIDSLKIGENRKRLFRGKQSPKLERKPSIITVASNFSIESMRFTELERQPKLRLWTPNQKSKFWVTISRVMN